MQCLLYLMEKEATVKRLHTSMQMQYFRKCTISSSGEMREDVCTAHETGANTEGYVYRANR